MRKILSRALALGWLKRSRDTRAVRLTASGRAGLLDAFGVDLSDGEPGIAVPTRVALRA